MSYTGISIFKRYPAIPGRAFQHPPARRAGHRRPFLCRCVRGLMGGASVARSRCRGWSGGARESQLFLEYIITTAITGWAYVVSNQNPRWTLNPYIPLFLSTILGPDYFLLFFFFSFNPLIYLRPSFLSPSYSVVVTQIRGHIAGSFPPFPTTVRALPFYREKISALSCLVDSRRTVLTHARRSQQLILFLFLQQKSKSSPTAGFEPTDEHQ